MHKIIVIFAASFLSLTCWGQKLVVGEKAPEMKVTEWLEGQSPAGRKGMLIEFFYSPSAPSRQRLPELDALARKYRSQLDVVVISREPKAKIEPFFQPGTYSYYVALDDGGRTFSNYEIQFVPFSALIDGRGRVVWFGNSSQLTEDDIRKAF